MIVSNDSVNVIALPYVWQVTDNYGYTHYYLQTNTLSQMVTIHSWPDFDDLPRGQPKCEWGQHCTMPRTRPDTTRPRPKNLALRPCWPWGLNIPAFNTQAASHLHGEHWWIHNAITSKNNYQNLSPQPYVSCCQLMIILELGGSPQPFTILYSLDCI